MFLAWLITLALGLGPNNNDLLGTNLPVIDNFLVGPTVVQPAPKTRADLPRETLGQARARAIKENKTLIVWSGDAICLSCIANDDSGEFVHFVSAQFEDYPSSGALVVSVPDGGHLWRVAEIGEWGEHGHIPTVRRTIKQLWETPPAQRRFVNTLPARTLSVTYPSGMTGSSMGYGGQMMGGGQARFFSRGGGRSGC